MAVRARPGERPDRPEARPATFHAPLYSFMGDRVMFKDMLVGRVKF